VFFGELNGAHSVLAASSENSISAELASKLDLPDTSPPGASWSPYLSGFPHRDRYVLARTMSDAKASRSGMVFSHALIGAKEEITAMPDLRPILRFLSNSPCRPQTSETITIEQSDYGSPPASEYLAAVANALTSHGNGPVVLLGDNGFDELVVALWSWLWPSIRNNFAFRLSFGPTDVVEIPTPAVVWTPVSLAGRWPCHRVIGPVTKPEATSLAASVLTGGPEREPMLKFADAIGAEIRDFKALNLLEQAYRLRYGSRFDELLTLVRLIQALSPTSVAGEQVKQQVLEKLCRLLQDATPVSILLLRNLHLSATTESDALWTSLRQWTAQNHFSAADDTQMATVLENALSSGDAIPEWRKAVLAGISDAAVSPDSQFPKAFWRLLQTHPKLVVTLFEYLPTNSDAEKMLVLAAPIRLDASAVEAITTLSLERPWFGLHGAALAAAYSPKDSARRQLTVDFDANNLEGLRLALRLATPEQKVESAIALNEPRIIQMATAEVAKNPKLLAEVDFRAEAAQEIWARALAVNKDAWRGPGNGESVMVLLLDRLLDGHAVSRELIIELASSPLADAHRYARRARLWSSLEGVARDKFLQASASGLLGDSEHELSRSTIEPELQLAILQSPELNSVLDRLASSRIGTALQLIGLIAQFGEAHFISWMRRAFSRVPSLAVSDAEAIGRLVLMRSWEKALDELASMVRRGRNDLKPALRICASLLSRWKRLLLGVAELSHSERWGLLEDTAVNLYPSGPDEKGLWERAGGQDGDLVYQGTGRSRWHHVMVQFERGKRFDIGRLLYEMERDYEKNDELKYLNHHLHLWDSDK
jgi:hypothetical protein